MKELAALFSRYGVAYLKRFGEKVLPSHRQAIEDIVSCRTEVLGGHKHQCDTCRALVYSYHSCKNRACPTCGYKETQGWLQKQQDKVLNTHYFHVVVTLPHEFNDVVRANQRLLYNLLLKTAFDSVKKVMRKEVCGKALMGAIAVLHTWSRTLTYHNHVHLLIPGAGIDRNGTLWQTPRKTFLIPEQVVASVFRAMFVKQVRKAIPGIAIPQKVFQKDWVVKILPTLSHDQQVLNYLGRYRNRTALTNKRIVKCVGDVVTFRYRDNETR